jgi:hypothetical protein
MNNRRCDHSDCKTPFQNPQPCYYCSSKFDENGKIVLKDNLKYVCVNHCHSKTFLTRYCTNCKWAFLTAGPIEDDIFLIRSRHKKKQEKKILDQLTRKVEIGKHWEDVKKQQRSMLKK